MRDRTHRCSGQQSKWLRDGCQHADGLMLALSKLTRICSVANEYNVFARASFGDVGTSALQRVLAVTRAKISDSFAVDSTVVADLHVSANVDSY